VTTGQVSSISLLEICYFPGVDTRQYGPTAYGNYISKQISHQS